MPKPTKSRAAADELIGQMDDFAKELLGLAKAAKKEGEDAPAEVALQTKLDVFAKVGAWVAIKNRVLGDDSGDDLDSLKQRLRNTSGPPRGGTARGKPLHGGGQLKAAWAQHGSHYPDGHGGPALEAVKRALPSANARDDERAGDGS